MLKLAYRLFDVADAVTGVEEPYFRSSVLQSFSKPVDEPVADATLDKLLVLTDGDFEEVD